METKIKRIGKSERGITLIALLITIVILVVLTAIVIQSISGDNGIIKVGTEASEDHEVVSYGEQINHVVHSEIISKSTIGQTASTENVKDALNEEDWIKQAVMNANPNSEVGDITVQVVEGYIYQIYYNPLYGKISVDYIGKDWDKSGDLTLTARYEKSITNIFATAEDRKHGVAKLELIYKTEPVLDIKQNPSGEQSWNIKDIGSGWYKIKATSNSGAIKYTWVKASNISDALTIPEITIETESKLENGWYGADQKEVWIKISTNSPSAKEIHYSLIGAHNTGENEVVIKGSELKEEGNTKYTRFQITETGSTHITACTEDGNGYSSEDNYEDVQFDNIAPILENPVVKGTAGNNSWYTSAVEIQLDAKDLNGKQEADLENSRATINGYIYTIYKIQNGTQTLVKAETKVDKLTNVEVGQTVLKPIKDEEALSKDGIYKLKIQAIDIAGNKSAEKEIEIKKDTEKPTVGEPKIENITPTGFRVTISAGDTTSEVAYYEYYLNGSLATTLNEGVWKPNNLADNATYNVTVKVYDNAGLYQDSITAPATTPSANTAPVVQSVTFSSKTTNSITVTARATDAQNDNLRYTMYVSTNGSNWTTATTSSSTPAGTTVTLTTPSNLTEYTQYYVKVRATETSTTQRLYNEKNCNVYPIRTYCSGSRSDV